MYSLKDATEKISNYMQIWRHIQDALIFNMNAIKNWNHENTILIS
jgi:hypothetical protein